MSLAPRPLRIAITHPYCWPQVRRGGERFLHDLSHYLAERGHEVTVFSTSPTGPARDRDGAVTRVLYRQRRTPAWLGRRLTPAHFFPLQCRRDLIAGRYDVVHCLSYYDAFGAALGARHEVRYFFQSMGIPVKRAFRTAPHDRLMFEYGLRRARRVGVISRFAADALRRDFGILAHLIPTAVDVRHFTPRGDGASKSEMAPTILMTGALDEPRKGARLLVRAFVRVKQAIPGARLVLSSPVSPATAAALLALVPEPLRPDVALLGAGAIGDLPRLYSEATITVLPAVWEPLGLVLLESMACGTPGVAARHGGVPDVVDSPDVGVLFDPGSTRVAADNEVGLVRAILDGLALARRPNTARRCREHAERFGWDRLGPLYEDLYREIARVAPE